MLISFIIPLYNCKDYIDICLSSIVNQVVDPDTYEVIVVNDGSVDGGDRIVSQKFEHKYQQIKLINQENKGLSSARNRGLQDARGDFVWFIDSDDRIVPNCLKQIIEILKIESPDLLRVEATNVNYLEPSKDAICGDFHYRTSHALDLETLVFFSGKPIIWNSVYVHIMKRTKIEELSLAFDETLATLEDQVFMMEYLFQSEKAIVVNANVYRRFIRETSVTNNKDINHLRKYNEGRVNAAIAIKKLNERFKDIRTSLCYDKMNEYCNDKALQGLMNMVRFGCDWITINRSINNLTKNNLYPFKDLNYFKLKGIRWKATRLIANSPLLLKIISNHFVLGLSRQK